MITKERVKQVMAEVDALDLSDGALGLVSGEVFDIITEDPEFSELRAFRGLERQVRVTPALEKSNSAPCDTA